MKTSSVFSPMSNISFIHAVIKRQTYPVKLLIEQQQNNIGRALHLGACFCMYCCCKIVQFQWNSIILSSGSGIAQNASFKVLKILPQINDWWLQALLNIYVGPAGTQLPCTSLAAPPIKLLQRGHGRNKADEACPTSHPQHSKGLEGGRFAAL